MKKTITENALYSLINQQMIKYLTENADALEDMNIDIPEQNLEEGFMDKIKGGAEKWLNGYNINDKKEGDTLRDVFENDGWKILFEKEKGNEVFYKVSRMMGVDGFNGIEVEEMVDELNTWLEDNGQQPSARLVREVEDGHSYIFAAPKSEPIMQNNGEEVAGLAGSMNESALRNLIKGAVKKALNESMGGGYQPDFENILNMIIEEALSRTAMGDSYIKNAKRDEIMSEVDDENIMKWIQRTIDKNRADVEAGVLPEDKLFHSDEEVVKHMMSGGSWARNMYSPEKLKSLIARGKISPKAEFRKGDANWPKYVEARPELMEKWVTWMKNHPEDPESLKYLPTYGDRGGNEMNMMPAGLNEAISRAVKKALKNL